MSSATQQTVSSMVAENETSAMLANITGNIGVRVDCSKTMFIRNVTFAFDKKAMTLVFYK